MRFARTQSSRLAAIFGGVLVAAASPSLAGHEGAVPFDSERSDLAGAKAIEHLGRRAILGTAFLRDAEFENGVIEFDAASGRP